MRSLACARRKVRVFVQGLAGARSLPKNYDDQGLSSQPVYVIETIPVPGDHEVSAQEIKREAIPIPRHLRLYPELGRGGMGRIHPATDRNLLRHVALKRLDQELAKEAVLSRRLHRRGADDRAARASEHRAGARARGRSERRAVFHDEARSGHELRSLAARSEAAARRRPNASRRGSRFFSRSATRSPTRTTAA